MEREEERERNIMERGEEGRREEGGVILEGVRAVLSGHSKEGGRVETNEPRKRLKKQKLSFADKKGPSGSSSSFRRTRPVDRGTVYQMWVLDTPYRMWVLVSPYLLFQQIMVHGI